MLKLQLSFDVGLLPAVEKEYVQGNSPIILQYVSCVGLDTKSKQAAKVSKTKNDRLNG
jgi:hypothetical protein